MAEKIYTLKTKHSKSYLFGLDAGRSAKFLNATLSYVTFEICEIIMKQQNKVIPSIEE